jgi:Calcineurin-like phosphoesterase
VTKVSTTDLLRLLKTNSRADVARKANLSERNIYKRLKRLKNKSIAVVVKSGTPEVTLTTFPWRAILTIKDGSVVIFGDCHYWPNEPVPLLHRALVSFIKEYRPKAIICIGDVLDAPTISRWQRIGWENQPQLKDEIEICQERLHEIERAAGRRPRIWALGNHDARFETRLANIAPEYAKIHGVHLRDHFPLWEPCWGAWINDGELVAKHDFKSGIYAPRNNTLNAGRSIATGHLHSAKVMPVSDWNGTRYGVDVGCIADTDGKQFVDYTRDNPKDWRSGFGYFTFKDGRLLEPELVTKWDDNHAQFRGTVFTP